MAAKPSAPPAPSAPSPPMVPPAAADGCSGLDGLAVEKLLGGAVLKGHEPSEILREAGIDPSVYGNEQAVIDGSALFRLVERIQLRLDDAYVGFLPERCRLALENERTRAYLHSGTFGEALRVSIRFTQALSSDIGPRLVETERLGVMHVCAYNTVEGVDRDIFVWLRFVWIYHLFSWLIGRPLKLRRVFVQGRRPVQANGFDRFALFNCPIEFGAPVDALCYDRNDLDVRLVHGTLAEYEAHNASAPDWFAPPGGELSWRSRTEQVLIQFQREGVWLPSIEDVAERLRSQPRRLRRSLAREGESFQHVRTRLRGEMAGALLLATDLPVTNVGYTVGFNEPGSFTRNFSEWAAMTPSEYRHRYKSDTARMAAATTLVAERREPHVEA
ncbi:AraC family transcriptional regulator [Caulobacter sp. Root487D2Y]|uniref:AraC family transcriptional regulator n=1 Tax=Caulobacter sp. Root487D2Y TaxID=1736547 RepID=UPI0006FD1458|nr:AraC family transcriptional regulator [Caulobacter sp. Root487D2Y]KQY28068.1 AraC family transcriptional regulator [Caulobacter sp. Root487D2Y]